MEEDRWVVKKDSRGRFIQVDHSVYKGHSACHFCGKDMPKVWDTVCYVCGITLCYDHSFSRNGHWYCPQHTGK